MTQQVVTLPNPEDIVMESGQPVRGFRGELVELVFGTSRSGSNATPLLFKHLKTEFFDTTTPYPNGAQYTVDCPWSERGTGRWAVICESAKACLGMGEEDRLVMGSLKGKMLEWRFTVGHPTRVPEVDGKPEGNWIASIMDAWIIAGIDSNRHPDFPTVGGEEPAPVAGGNGIAIIEEEAPVDSLGSEIFEGVEETAPEYALAIAYGRSNAQWQNLALNHPVIKADKAYWDRIVAEGAEVFAGEERIKYENDVFVKGE